MLCYAVLQHLLKWGQGGDWHSNMRGLPQPAQVSDMSVSVGAISRQLFEAVQGICLTHQAAQGTWVMHPKVLCRFSWLVVCNKLQNPVDSHTLTPWSSNA
jgi:hypothetical protein